jgi:hypothetical protein
MIAEKWNPVFGNDHAPKKSMGAAMIHTSRKEG